LTLANRQTSSFSQKLAMEYIVLCMNKHGICVVDRFVGTDTGLGILVNVKALHKTGKFSYGQLVRDKIMWIEGREASCEKILVCYTFFVCGCAAHVPFLRYTMVVCSIAY
uniref:Uncharacterized protein n=1 Tax=Amphiprion ocellaris TaxID=80972 RepID=A0AAQ6A0X4_AMPOC